MSVKKEIGLIARGVGKGLASIIVPPKEEEKPEFMKIHWCPVCKKYHKAE